MDPKILLLIVAIIVAVLVIAWAIVRNRRRAELQQRFGPEYERVTREYGQGRAESLLAERERRVEKFATRRLAIDEREHFITQWRAIQSHFVDDPQSAVREADLLVIQLMQARGYPMSEFEQRAADISVDYPRVVDNYRAAHEIALRQQGGAATTEDLRNAVIYYRSLFDELLETKLTGNYRREVA